MRISGGDARGKTLKAPKHGGVRPTSDKVKKALFSILGERLDGARYLELFAGTGSVGLDALSRGAERAVFVDSNQKSARLIRENLDATGYRDKAAVVAKDALVFLKKDAEGLGPFDLVFVDPPYHTGIGEKAMEMLGAACDGLLAEGATVVFEHFRKNVAPDGFWRLVKRRDYNYGDTVLSLYIMGRADAPGEDAGGA